MVRMMPLSTSGQVAICTPRVSMNRLARSEDWCAPAALPRRMSSDTASPSESRSCRAMFRAAMSASSARLIVARRISNAPDQHRSIKESSTHQARAGLVAIFALVLAPEAHWRRAGAERIGQRTGAVKGADVASASDRQAGWRRNAGEARLLLHPTNIRIQPRADSFVANRAPAKTQSQWVAARKPALRLAFRLPAACAAKRPRERRGTRLRGMRPR